MDALGMVEVYGFTTAVLCADRAAKAAAVKIIALDTNKPANADTAEVPLVMNVKMEGSVSAVTEGVSAAKAAALEKGLYITSHIISRPGIDIEKLARLSNVGRDRFGRAGANAKPEAAVKKPPKRRGGKYSDLPKEEGLLSGDGEITVDAGTVTVRK
jgi:microcompartment protein CcmL/EutN